MTEPNDVDPVATIRSIAVKPDASRPPSRYHRVSVDRATLVAGHGIEGDEKGGAHPERQLNLMGASTLEALAAAGFRTGPGEMGEQVVVDGIDVDTLEPGTRLRLGDDAEIRVTKLRTGCARFEAIQGHPRTDVVGRLGAMAAVVRGGTVRRGDRVTVSSHSGEQLDPT